MRRKSRKNRQGDLGNPKPMSWGEGPQRGPGKALHPKYLRAKAGKTSKKIPVKPSNRESKRIIPGGGFHKKREKGRAGPSPVLQ